MYACASATDNGHGVLLYGLKEFDNHEKYAIGIDLGGTSVKYALIDNEGVFHFQGSCRRKPMYLRKR